MSLIRLIIWSSLIGGWSAFFGWLFSEVILHYWIDKVAIAILMATLVAIPIGGGICLASGLTNPRMDILIKRLLFGFAGGLLGGLAGVLVGSCLFGGVSYLSEKIASTLVLFVGQVIGWTIIGVGIGTGIGASEGFIERSFNKFRNGLIGGILGGFLGGLFFGIASYSVGSLTGRAVSFVLLGLCIGLFIGLAQVILKEAWLTVEAGFRPGRQMILGGDLITMGTSEKSSLIFIAMGAKGVEPTHLKITKQPDGRYLLEDNQSRSGTFVNGEPIMGPTPLKDGDAIQLGVNVVRFNERAKHSGSPKLPPANVQPPAPVVSAGAIQAKTPAPPSPIQAKPPTPPSPIQAKTPPPAPKPASTPNMELPPKPAASPKPAAPQEAACPSCGKKVHGVPGQRFCKSCFQTF